MTITISLPNELPPPQVEGTEQSSGMLQQMPSLTAFFPKYMIHMAASMPGCPLSTRSACPIGRQEIQLQTTVTEQPVLGRKLTMSLWRNNLSRDCVLYVLGSCSKLGKSVPGRRHSLGMTQAGTDLMNLPYSRILVFITYHDRCLHDCLPKQNVTTYFSFIFYACWLTELEICLTCNIYLQNE